MHRSAALALSLVALVAAPSARADDRGPLVSHPIALGLRGIGRVGDYTLAGVGGQLRLRVHPLVNISLYTDHMFGGDAVVSRHDHEVGGTLELNVLRGARWSLHPLVGACALLAMAHQSDADLTLNDVWFGLRAGVGGEFAVHEHLSLQVQLQVLGYLGHRFNSQRWTGEDAGDLHVTPMGQLVVGINYGI